MSVVIWHARRFRLNRSAFSAAWNSFQLLPVSQPIGKPGCWTFGDVHKNINNSLFPVTLLPIENVGEILFIGPTHSLIVGFIRPSATYRHANAIILLDIESMSSYK
jgi:hypothetical protein